MGDPFASLLPLGWDDGWAAALAEVGTEARPARVLQHHGVPHYWLIDLEHQVLTVYRLRDGEYLVAALAQPGERARLEPFDAIELEVSLLFGDPTDEG